MFVLFKVTFYVVDDDKPLAGIVFLPTQHSGDEVPGEYIVSDSLQNNVMTILANDGQMMGATHSEEGDRVHNRKRQTQNIVLVVLVYLNMADPLRL